MTKKQKINCDVKDCKYNNTNDQECTLDEITVKSSTYFENDDNCKDKDDTICDDFEKNKDNIDLDEVEQEEYDEKEDMNEVETEDENSDEIEEELYLDDEVIEDE